MKNLILKSLVLLTLVGCGNDVILNKERNYLEEKSKILYYKGSPLNGHLIEYYDDELTKLKSTYTFKEGLQIGPFEVYHYSNGTLKQKGNYNTFFTNQPYEVYLDGWIEDYYDNGQLKYKSYIEGRYSTKEDISYYENGQLKEKGNYSQKFLDDDGTYEYVKTGLWEGYFEDGSERLRKPYDNNGNLEGEIFEYDLDSKGKKRLISKGFYKNGKREGEFFFFQEDIKNVSISNYKNGLREGKSLRISNVKSVDEKGNYIGIIREKGSYKIINSKNNPESVKDGLWEEYDYYNGKLLSKGMFKIVDYGDGNQESVKDGWWEYYVYDYPIKNNLEKKIFYYKNFKIKEIEYHERYNLGYGWKDGYGYELKTFNINEDKFGYVSYERNKRESIVYKTEYFLNGKQYKTNIFL